jgi:hypothetical protein
MCRIVALQFEHTKLGAIATTSVNGQDFASLLERAILRSGKGREIMQIEGNGVDLTLLNRALCTRA